MEKFKATKKQFAYETVLKVGYCQLQTLLKFENPIAYSSGFYGWSCDYYQVGSVYICTGYSPIGKEVNYSLIKKYENAANAVETKEAMTKLLNDFVKEAI